MCKGDLTDSAVVKSLRIGAKSADDSCVGRQQKSLSVMCLGKPADRLNGSAVDLLGRLSSCATAVGVIVFPYAEVNGIKLRYLVCGVTFPFSNVYLSELLSLYDIKTESLGCGKCGILFTEKVAGVYTVDLEAFGDVLSRQRRLSVTDGGQIEIRVSCKAAFRIGDALPMSRYNKPCHFLIIISWCS